MNVGIYTEYTFEGDVFDLMGEEDLAALRDAMESVKVDHDVTCLFEREDVENDAKDTVTDILNDIFSDSILAPEEELRVAKGWKIVGGDSFMDDLGPMLFERFEEQNGLPVLCGCEDFCVSYLGADKKIAKLERKFAKKESEAQ